MKIFGTRYVFCASVLSTVVLMSIFCNVTMAAEVITAKLKATPEMATSSTNIKFQATIFFKPEFYAKPGEMIQVLVTKDDFSWVSDKINIQYPGAGTKVVNFTKCFSIAAAGTSIKEHNFVLVNKIWWRMSNTATVKVITRQKRKKLKRAETILPITSQ